MRAKRLRTTIFLAGALLTMTMVGAGCAGGPKYGASRKQSKNCDCPKWNAVPKQAGKETWCMNASGGNAGDLQRVVGHDRRN